MKTILLACCFLITKSVFCQKTDTLAWKVYQFKEPGAKSTTLAKGSTADLENLNITVQKLGKGGSFTFRPNPDHEILVVVKEGSLACMIETTKKELNPGGLAWISDNTAFTLENKLPANAVYYVLEFKAKKTVAGTDMPKFVIKDWQDLVMRKTEKGESRPIMEIKTLMFPRFEMHATALNPGIESHPAHTHRDEEIILMIKGNITMQIGDKFLKSNAGDFSLVGPNVPHKAHNTGDVMCGYFAIQWKAY